MKRRDATMRIARSSTCPNSGRKSGEKSMGENTYKNAIPGMTALVSVAMRGSHRSRQASRRLYNKSAHIPARWLALGFPLSDIKLPHHQVATQLYWQIATLSKWNCSEQGRFHSIDKDAERP